MKGIKRKSDGEERKEREGSEALAVQRYEKNSFLLCCVQSVYLYANL